MRIVRVHWFFSCGGEEVGEGLFVFRFGGELLFGVGQDALGRRSADAGAGVGLDGFDLRECLLLRLTHLCLTSAAVDLQLGSPCVIMHTLARERLQ